jgi:hypothetical protein
MTNRTEEAGVAVQRALLACIGPAAAEQLATAQLRLAWQETVADAGLNRGGLSSWLVRHNNGTGYVEASESILAQELTLRADALLASVNRRMKGRPGATIELARLAISVGRGAGSRSL